MDYKITHEEIKALEIETKAGAIYPNSTIYSEIEIEWNEPRVIDWVITELNGVWLNYSLNKFYGKIDHQAVEQLIYDRLEGRECIC
jgi:hypothetical protein